jgi:NADPH-dependent 2,4-dienoyl-CoA reductase/sulfur reductase-like enzyme
MGDACPPGRSHDEKQTAWDIAVRRQGMKTVIVGGVAAGASTGARLRRLDESADIVLLERGSYVSFANCGLLYHISGEIPDRASLFLQTPESLAKSLALDVRTGQEVTLIDREAKQVEVHDLPSRACIPAMTCCARRRRC